MSAIHGANYGTPTLDLNFSKNKSLIDTVSGQNLVTFTRSSTGTYVGADGLIKTAVADEPRFDHNPLTGECLGLLVEEARTNSVTKSEDNTGWNNAGGTTTISNAGSLVLSPSNTTNVTLSTPVSGFVDRNTVVVYGISQPTSNTIYTFSCFIKKKDLRYVVISLTQEAWAYWQTAFDLDTGTLLTSSTFAGPPTNTNYTIQSYPNGWYRFSVTMGLTNTGGATYCNIGFTNKSTGVFGIGGQASYVADGISGGYLWGAQVEVGSFPTSYIPTTGSTVTRSADTASITGTNFSRWYNPSESTWFAEGDQLYINENDNQDGVNSIFVDRYANISTQRWRENSWRGIQDSTAIIPPFNTTTTPQGDKVKTVYAIDGVTAQMSVGGVLSSTASLTSYPGVTELRIGESARLLTIDKWKGHISRLTYYPTRLQDFQLQQLTK